MQSTSWRGSHTEFKVVNFWGQTSLQNIYIFDLLYKLYLIYIQYYVIYDTIFNIIILLLFIFI